MKIAIIAPVHRRHKFLWLARRQLMAIPGCEVKIFYFTDRLSPHAAVELVSFDEDSVSMPFPIVDGSSGDFPKAWEWQTQFVLQRWDPDFMGIWDDDMILTAPEEVPPLLETADVIYGPKLFLWDDVTHYNAKMEHNSAVFFRVLPDDHFHPKSTLQVHAPRKAWAADASKRSTLPTFVLDYGFMSQEDRLQVFSREKRTGKIDGFTLPLVGDPDLTPLPDALKTKSLEFARHFH
jgi:hypothetical protein